MTSYDELLARYKKSINKAEGILLDFVEFRRDLLIEISGYTLLAQGRESHEASGDPLQISDHTSTDGNPIVENFDRTVRALIATYELHTRPHVPGTPLDAQAHIYGCCGHMWDTYHKMSRSDFPDLDVHVYSNTPKERLCFRCAKHRKRIHTHDCTLCARDDDHHYSSMYRKRAVVITTYREPPMDFYIPMCRRCRTILASESNNQDWPTRGTEK